MTFTISRKNVAWFVGPLVLLLAGGGFAAAGSDYDTGTLLSIDKEAQRTPRTWLWNTVVTATEVVSYKLRVRVGNQIYEAEYVPDVQPDGPLPTEWKPGNPVQARTEDHKLLVKLSYGRVIELNLLRRSEAKSP
jgi:hypothetical protein